MKSNQKPRSYAFGLQKGGVGKTMSCLMLSYVMSQMGYRVLAIDYDPQGNLSESFGYDYELTQGCTIFEVVTGQEAITNCIIKTQDGIDLIASNDDLYGLTQWLFNQKEALGQNALYILRDALLPVMNADTYDYIFVDLPPSKDLITMTALAAVNKVIIPCQPERYAITAIPRFLATVQDVQQLLNPNLDLAGILVTMADFRTGLHSDLVPKMRKTYGDHVFENVVKRMTRLADATLMGIKTLRKKDLEGNYFDVAQELIARG